MKKLLVLILVLGSLVCSAQNNTQPTPGATYLTSPNLLLSTQGSWTGTVAGSAGGTSGGPTPAFNTNTNTIIFSYASKTVSQTYAFNQALQSAGLSIGGYDYSWKINNNDSNTGFLTGKFTLKSLTGTALQTYNYTYNDKTTGDSENFQTFSGTQWFPQNHSSSNISSFTMEWTGQDDRFWAGYYGPRVRQPSISLRYLVDPCAADPLSSPNCPGYAEAYKTQQCTANPLYDPTCPGYAVALKTQQCNINPMSDPTCPNYQSYLNEQCLKDSLFSTLCEGYKTAYAIKYIVNLDPAVTSAVNQQLTTNNEIARNDPAKVTVVSSTVDSVLSTPTTTSATSTSPASVTSVVNQPPPPPPGASPIANAAASAAAPPPPPPPSKVEERAQEQKRTDGEVARVERKSGGNQESARKEVAQKAKELAQNAGKANTMEGQVATQGLLVGLIGYVPGFAGYQQATLPDTMAQELAIKYAKPVVDNRNAQRRMQGASDRLHNEMVESQYK